MARHCDFSWGGIVRFLLCSALFLPSAALAQRSSEGHSEPEVADASYQRFFAHFVDNRSISTRVLTSVGIPENLVGRSLALVAGVSRYPKLDHENQLLQPARVDLDNLVRYLRDEEFFDEIVVLRDQDVTYDNLAFFLQSYLPHRLSQFPHSRFLFAYSGHGFTEGNSSYVLRSDAENFTDRAHSINLTNVKVLVDEVVQEPSTKVLVLLNSCNSGAFLKRAFGPPPQYLFMNDGAHAITAGTSKELAWAYPEVGPGSVFFEKLFVGLGGPAVASDREGRQTTGIITADELYSYIRREVQLVTDGRQSPQFGDISRDGSSGSFYFLNRGALVSAHLAAVWKSQSAEADTQSTSSLGRAWPPNVVLGGSYLVTSAERSMTIPLLQLPDEFTLRFAADVQDVRWEVGTLAFGKNATIDLSAPPESLQPGEPGQDRPGQPSWGVRGIDGGTGASGMPGRAGVGLILNAGTLLQKGSLWVRTDGGPGGPGGRGGNGQLGGGWSCGNLREPHTDGGDGGIGGVGGPGGKGGPTSHVRIAGGDHLRVLYPQLCPTTCGRSARPSSANGDEGRIVILGTPGCGGKAGPGGASGGGGDEGHTKSCDIGPINLGDVHGGSTPPQQRGGNPGDPGVCSY
jgi:hypothetical protein